jgi:hypothetical protein
MDVYKLRVKLGADEFEAEGSQDYVETQRDFFISRIDKAGAHIDHKEKPAADTKKGEHSPTGKVDSKPPVNNLPVSLEAMGKIVHQNENLITLTAMPGGDNAEGDALLLLLLGHKVLRNEDLILAGDLVAGMKQSGFSSVDRMDRVVLKVGSSFVSSVGNRKGKKYRLLNPGVTKAKELAEKLIATVS